jgi:hypothetical protein
MASALHVYNPWQHYSPSAIAIGHDAIIAITDRDATTRIVACFANTHAVVLSSLPLTDEIAATQTAIRRFATVAHPY